MVLGGCSETLADADYLASRKVRIWLDGHQAFSAAARAIHDTQAAIRAGTRASGLRNLAPAALMAKLTRAADYEAAMQDYLGG
jgi:carboxyvinyl-carboxyphosphonate phosphorylmutase